MKRNYIYPIVEVSMCVRTSVLCASGETNPVVSVDPNPVSNTVID